MAIPTYEVFVRLSHVTLAVLIVSTGCNQPALPPTSTNSAAVIAPEPDGIEAQLARLVNTNAALTFPLVGVAEYGALTTLDYQEAMDRLRGKSVGFIAMLGDVYRTEDGFRVAFGPFDSHLDAGIILNATEKQARQLSQLIHSDLSSMYAVIAELESLKVYYDTAQYVSGEKGQHPDTMDVEEFGFEVRRVLTGRLIAFEVEEN